MTAALRASRQRWRRTGLPVLLLIVLAALVLLPIAFMFLGAVMSGGLSIPDSHFTLEKLAAVYTTLPYLRTLGSTLAIAAGVGALATAAGVALAWLIARTDLPAPGFMETCVIAPLFLSPFVGALAWLVLGSPESGILNVIATEIFGATGPVINVATPTGIVVIMALYFVPYAYLTVSASLRNIDPAMEEASYLNGAGVIATAWRVTLPVVRPALCRRSSSSSSSAPAPLRSRRCSTEPRQVRFLAVDCSRPAPPTRSTTGRRRRSAPCCSGFRSSASPAMASPPASAQRFVTVTARGYRIRRVRLRGARIRRGAGGAAVLRAGDRAALPRADLRRLRALHLSLHPAGAVTRSTTPARSPDRRRW